MRRRRRGQARGTPQRGAHADPDRSLRKAREGKRGADRPRGGRRGAGRGRLRRAPPASGTSAAGEYGPRRRGPAERPHDGRRRCGSARLGSARLGSARLGSARLGSARLGSARLGSARLGSATIVPPTVRSSILRNRPLSEAVNRMVLVLLGNSRLPKEPTRCRSALTPHALLERPPSLPSSQMSRAFPARASSPPRPEARE